MLWSTVLTSVFFVWHAVFILFGFLWKWLLLPPIFYVHICEANTSGIRVFVDIRAWQASSLWRVWIQSVCLCHSSIRCLFGCRPQSPLDPLRQNRLIPKWPQHHRSPATNNNSTTGSGKRTLAFQKPEAAPSLHCDSPPAPDSMQYSRQFEPTPIHHS